jgi:hypothetical protein
MTTRLQGQLVEWDRRMRSGWIETASGMRYSMTAGAFPGRRPPALGTAVSFRPLAGAFGWRAARIRGLPPETAVGAALGPAELGRPEKSHAGDIIPKNDRHRFRLMAAHRA